MNYNKRKPPTFSSAGFKSQGVVGSQAAASDMILEQLNQRKLDRQHTSLNSAALQDHIMKSFKLSDMDPFKKKTTAQNKIVQPRATSNLQQSGLNIIQSNSMHRQQNSQSSQRLQQQSDQQQLIRSTTVKQEQQNPITKILQDQTAKDESAYIDIEEKRIQYINKLSLAQRLGLVEKPALPLSQVQWREIEEKSLKRFNEKEPCPICYEELRLQEQTILSCSHVFHKKCLESFEKFMKHKGHERACPICRKKDYDQKTYIEGQKKYLMKCIVRIQGLVKGFLARNHFYQGLKNQSYQPWNASLKKKLIGYKLSRIGKRYLDHMTKERQAILDTVQKVDKSIEDTEKLLESYIPNMAKYFLQKREKELEQRKLQREEEKLNKFWQGVKDKAIQRGDKDCPICYNPYKTCKDVYLLNCSHMYHICCLESFEKYDIATNQCCPMCRHPNYEKVKINS